MLKRPRRVLVAVVLVIGMLLALTAVGFEVLSEGLDPGDKHDTSTNLVTPTLAGANSRVFQVSPENSQIDFVTRISGLELNGVFPVTEGKITLEPVGADLRVHVELRIDVDHVDTGNASVNDILRGIMETGDYPLAFYVATSRELVPVTEEVIYFDLDGDLEVHNVAAAHAMAVEAQEIGPDMWAVATSDLDLADHGVELPAFLGSTVIELTARLEAHEWISPETAGAEAAQ